MSLLVANILYLISSHNYEYDMTGSDKSDILAIYHYYFCMTIRGVEVCNISNLSEWRYTINIAKPT